MKRGGLGRGLSSLIPGAAQDQGLLEVPVAAVSPNPRQPRAEFPEESLAALARSIREVGVIQPMVVVPATAATSWWRGSAGCEPPGWPAWRRSPRSFARATTRSRSRGPHREHPSRGSGRPRAGGGLSGAAGGPRRDPGDLGGASGVLPSAHRQHHPPFVAAPATSNGCSRMGGSRPGTPGPCWASPKTKPGRRSPCEPPRRSCPFVRWRSWSGRTRSVPASPSRHRPAHRSRRGWVRSKRSCRSSSRRGFG